jgi:hypothetical protein
MQKCLNLLSEYLLTQNIVFVVNDNGLYSASKSLRVVKGTYEEADKTLECT